MSITNSELTRRLSYVGATREKLIKEINNISDKLVSQQLFSTAMSGIRTPRNAEIQDMADGITAAWIGRYESEIAQLCISNHIYNDVSEFSVVLSYHDALIVDKELRITHAYDLSTKRFKKI